ncbi:MAG: acylphosphatase [Mucilaginibacter sp.]
MIKHLDIIVKGKVQGVFFRGATKAVADQLGVKGNIRNDASGDVVIAAEGDKMSLEMFLDWCNEGPQNAVVTSVESHEGELKNYRNFDVVKKGLF